MDTNAASLAPTGDAAAPAAPTRSEQQSDIVTERSGSILRVQLNRPAKKNAMTSAMYATLAEILNDAAKDDGVRVVVLHEDIRVGQEGRAGDQP